MGAVDGLSNANCKTAAAYKNLWVGLSDASNSIVKAVAPSLWLVLNSTSDCSIFQARIPPLPNIVRPKSAERIPYGGMNAFPALRQTVLGGPIFIKIFSTLPITHINSIQQHNHYIF